MKPYEAFQQLFFRDRDPGDFPFKFSVEVTNQFGSLFVETGKVTALWVPTGLEEEPGIATDPGDATHFICYRAKTSKIPSDQAPATELPASPTPGTSTANETVSLGPSVLTSAS